MQITIGMKDVTRELSFEVNEDIADEVTKALSGKSDVLDVTDDKGNRILVAAAAIAYVHVGSDEHRFVGFGA